MEKRLRIGAASTYIKQGHNCEIPGEAEQTERRGKRDELRVAV
jgi:hypothetical protein